MVRAVAVFGLLGALAGAGVAAAPGAGAAVASCRVLNHARHASYRSLGAAMGAASSGATLLVSGTCTGVASISKNLTITALKGPGSARLNGDKRGTVLTVGAVTVTLNGLTITGGTAPAAANHSGGGIYNDGTLTLDNTTVKDNTAESYGAGIYNASGATLSLEGRTSVSHNKASGEVGEGAGIYNAGTVTVTGSASVSDNTVSGEFGEGGGIFNGDGASLTVVKQASVTGNVTQYAGGGIYTDLGLLTIGGQASVSRNTTVGDYAGGGGIYISGGTVTIRNSASVSDNTAMQGGEGGGIVNNASGTLTLSGQVSLDGNTAGYGGGVDNLGTLTLAGDASVSHNTALFGGGIFSTVTLTVGGSASVSSNTAQYGGGIYNNGTATLIAEATVSTNTATGGADSGGGIFSTSGATLTGAVAGPNGNVFANQPDDIYVT
jgi:hypothetical protein